MVTALGTAVCGKRNSFFLPPQNPRRHGLDGLVFHPIEPVVRGPATHIAHADAAGDHLQLKPRQPTESRRQPG